MNEVAWFSADTINIVSLAASLVVLLLVVLLWFFMNRASLRANEQIALLEELVDLQKRQNSLLRRLCEANEPETVVETVSETLPEDDLVRMVAER
ncbi:YebO family protein [uncultured Cedecea sp.]|uniref:YebO family protein n=1 Tax=uncultured Cedecea sp. TaxID=988762 RepID=UPI0026107493|nr:YebO family protein [uncultured Cedecea sp.]